jgi:hypothetical protein
VVLVEMGGCENGQLGWKMASFGPCFMGVVAGFMAPGPVGLLVEVEGGKRKGGGGWCMLVPASVL